MNLSKISFLIFFSVFSCFSQEFTIKWSELEKSTGSVLKILPGNENDFYTLRWSGGAMLGSYRATLHQNLSVSATGKLSMQVNHNMANFEDLLVINGKLMLFLSDRKDGENQLYMSELSAPEFKQVGQAREIASYELPKGKNKGSFQLITSENYACFGVIWSISGKNDNQDRYGFKIYTAEEEEISSGEYELPFPGDLSVINNSHLSDRGDYFLCVTEYERATERKNSPLNFKALHVYHVDDEGIDDMDVSLDDRKVIALKMDTNDKGLFTLTGVYSENAGNAASGIFYMEADFTKKEILNEGFEPFTKDFITADWTEKEKQKADKNAAKGKGEPQLYNYLVRDVEVLDDGSMVGTMEQYYERVVSYYNPQTRSYTYNYYYYYCDVIVFKINAGGGFEWLNKVRKYQVSVNDSGHYSSYAQFLDNGVLCLIFNDHVENYDLSGDYIDKNDDFKATSFSKKKNVAALVKIDVKSGDMSRKTFFDRKEITALVVPKLFYVNYQQKNMLMYAVYGKKERFGVLNF